MAESRIASETASVKSAGRRSGGLEKAAKHPAKAAKGRKAFSKPQLESGGRVEKSRYGGAQETGLQDPESTGALTAGVTREVVSGQAADEGEELSALEQLVAQRKAQRLEEIALKLELEAQVDPMQAKKHGLLCKLRGGHTLAVSDCQYTDDGKYITSCSFDGSVVTYDIKHQKVKRVYEGHVGMVFACQYVPRAGNKLLATVGQDSTARVWDRKSGKCKLVLKEEQQHSLYTVAWSPNGKRLATAGEDRSIIVWDIKTALECADDPTLTNEAIVDFKMFPYPQNFHGHRGPIRKLLFARDGKSLISCSDDGRIKNWKLGSSGGGAVSVSIDAHAGGVLDMDMSPHGVKFASCSRDGTIKQWYTKSGLQLTTFVGHGGCVYTVRYTREAPLESESPPVGRRLVSGGHDLSVIVWDAETGAVLHRMAGIHRSYILSVAVKPDGREFATASGDHTVGVWRAVAPTNWDRVAEAVQGALSSMGQSCLEALGLSDHFSFANTASAATAGAAR